MTSRILCLVILLSVASPLMASTLLIRSDIDAQILIDGKNVATVSQGELKKLEVSPGSHIVKALTADGKYKDEQIIKIGVDSQEVFDVKLKRQIMEGLKKYQKEVSLKEKQEIELELKLFGEQQKQAMIAAEKARALVRENYFTKSHHFYEAVVKLGSEKFTSQRDEWSGVMTDSLGASWVTWDDGHGSEYKYHGIVLSSDPILVMLRHDEDRLGLPRGTVIGKFKWEGVSGSAHTLNAIEPQRLYIRTLWANEINGRLDQDVKVRKLKFGGPVSGVIFNQDVHCTKKRWLPGKSKQEFKKGTLFHAMTYWLVFGGKENSYCGETNKDKPKQFAVFGDKRKKTPTYYSDFDLLGTKKSRFSIIGGLTSSELKQIASETGLEIDLRE